jgi:hypothetical protein
MEEKMDKKTAIEECQKIARDEYETLMKNGHCFNPDFKRTWDKIVIGNDSEGYALSGTPPKAYVFVLDKEVIALTMHKIALKTIPFE